MKVKTHVLIIQFFRDNLNRVSMDNLNNLNRTRWRCKYEEVKYPEALFLVIIYFLKLEKENSHPVPFSRLLMGMSAVAVVNKSVVLIHFFYESGVRVDR